MRKLDFWRLDWLLSGLVALIFPALWDQDLVQSLKRKACDLGVQAISRTPSDKIAIIAIDKQSYIIELMQLHQASQGGAAAPQASSWRMR
jgi:CHASE2 domain-containing sensor protein